MKNQDNSNQQQIEAYLLGQLGPAEHAAFEQAIQQDASLAQNVALERMTIDGIAAFSRKKMRERLQEFHEELSPPAKQPEQPAPKVIPLTWWRIAAAASIFLAVLSYFWWARPALPEQLYAQYFSPYELSLTQRSDNDRQVFEVEQGYRQKDYSAAIPMFEALLEENNQNAQLHLGAGIAQMELQQTEAALAHFQYIIDADDFLYRDQAIWYAALAHLHAGQLEQCRQHLQKLAQDPKADHHREALSLLQKL